MELGRGHPGVARADDLVHPPDGLGSVGERRHRLCTTHGVQLVDLEQACRRQEHLGHGPVGARRAGYDDLIDTGQPSGQTVISRVDG